MEELRDLEQATRKAAELVVSEGQFETQLQREAAILTEQLRILSSQVTYAHDRLKGTILKRLEKGELWSMHPSRPGSLNELLTVNDIGISKSEASDLLAWETVIFPWFEKNKGMRPWEVWNLLPKTRWRRIIRVMRAVIDENHHSVSEQVRKSVEALREECSTTEEMVDRLIEIAQNALTTRDLEKTIYPSEIPPVLITLKTIEGGYRGTFIATEAQVEVLRSYRKVEVMYD